MSNEKNKYISVQCVFTEMSVKRYLSGTEKSVRSIDLFAILKFMHDNKITDDVDDNTIQSIAVLSTKIVGRAAAEDNPIIKDASKYRVQMANFFKQFKVKDSSKRKFDENILITFKDEFEKITITISDLPEIFQKILGIKGCIGTTSTITASEDRVTLYSIATSCTETAEKLTMMDKLLIGIYMRDYAVNTKHLNIKSNVLLMLNERNLANPRTINLVISNKDILLKYSNVKKSLPYSLLKALVLYDEAQGMQMSTEEKDFDDGDIDAIIPLGSYLWRLFDKKYKNSENSNHLNKITEILLKKSEEIKPNIESCETIDEETKQKLSNSIDEIFRDIETLPAKTDATYENCVFLNSYTPVINLSYESLSDFVHEFCRKSGLHRRLDRDQLFVYIEARSALYSFKFPNEAMLDNEKDSVFIGRYDTHNDKIPRTLDENLSKETMISIAYFLPRGALRTVIAGGISVLLRYNMERITQDNSNALIHSFSPPPKNAETDNLITAKLNIREAQFQNILDYGFYENIKNPGLPNINAKRIALKGALTNLKNKGNDERDAFVKICESDILNAERIMLFGMAVLFRGAVEVFSAKGYDYSRLLAHTGIDNLTQSFHQMEIQKPGSVNENLAKWYNILSCIIHATNSDEGRLFNEKTYRKYFQVIRWEILNIFRIFYSDPAKSAHIPVNPRLQSLYTLDRLVDMLYLLELH